LHLDENIKSANQVWLFGMQRFCNTLDAAHDHAQVLALLYVQLQSEVLRHRLSQELKQTDKRNSELFRIEKLADNSLRFHGNFILVSASLFVDCHPFEDLFFE